MALAPTAHADFDDLFAPFFDFASGADFAEPAGAVIAPDHWLDDFTHPLQGLEHIFGGHDVAAPAAASIAAPAEESSPSDADVSSRTIDLITNPSYVHNGNTAGGEPTVSVSVGGGKDIPVLVDTGSNGLLIPWWDFGFQNIDWSHIDLLHLLQFGGYTGGVGYVALQLPTTVEFGGNEALTAQDVPVNVMLLSYPTTLPTITSSGQIDWDWTIRDMLGPANADGIMGIGAPLNGAANISPVLGLSGDLSKGVLIDQQDHTMTFGPYTPTQNDVQIPTNTSGNPAITNSYSNLYVKVGEGGDDTAHKVTGLIDSGGVFGNIPSNAVPTDTPVSSAGALPNGTVVTVYAPNANGDGPGTPLYHYTVNNPTATGAPSIADKELAPSPTVTDANTVMNTGNWLFQQHPVYVGYSGADNHVTYTVLEAGSQSQ